MSKKRKYPILNELKGKIREEGKTYRTLHIDTGLSVDAINNKLNGYSTFNGIEVELFVLALNIDINEITRYFFLHLVRFVSKTNEAS